MDRADRSRRALLLFPVFYSALAGLAGCAGGVGTGLIDHARQEFADLGKLTEVGSGRLEMGNPELAALRDRPLLPGPGALRDISAMRRAVAAMLLGDASGVWELAELPDSPQVLLAVRMQLLLLHGYVELMQGRELAAVPYLLKAERMVGAEAGGAALPADLAIPLQMGVSVAIDAGLNGTAARLLARLPPSLEQPNTPSLRKFQYRVERQRLLAFIAVRSGRYAESMTFAREAVRVAVEDGQALRDSARRDVYFSQAVSRNALALMAAQNGRAAEIEEQVDGLKRILAVHTEPAIERFLVNAETLLAHTNRDFAGAARRFGDWPVIIWERNWPFVARSIQFRRAYLRASGGDLVGARAGLTRLGGARSLGQGPVGILAACLDMYLAVELREPLVAAAQRMRELEPQVLPGLGPELSFIYWAARAIGAMAVARSQGLDGIWLDDASRSALAMRERLLVLRKTSLTFERAFPESAMRTALNAALEAAAEAVNRKKMSFDDLLQIAALAQESEVDAAVSASLSRRAPPSGLNTDDMRQLQDAQLAARETQLRWAQSLETGGREADPNSNQYRAMQDALASLERLIDAFERRSPGFTSWLVAEAPNAGRIRSNLQPSDLWLAMVPIGAKCVVMAVTLKQARVRLQGIDRGTSLTLIQRIRQSVSATPSRPFDFEAAQQVYTLLFGGFDDLVRGSNRMFVSVSGELSALPFACLLRGGQPLRTSSPTATQYRAAAWLVRSHTLVQLASLARWSGHEPVAAPGSSAVPLMSWANPAFGDECAVDSPRNAGGREGSDGFDVAGLDRLGVDWASVNFPCLPATRAEAEALARVIGPGAVMIQGPAATRASVLRASQDGQLRQASILHFATHGLAPGEVVGVREPALVMSKADGAMASQLLTLDDIFGLRISARMVLLSACNTASAARPGGDALGGLVRGFLYSGARSVMGTHWAVHDKSASEFVAQFMRLSSPREASTAQALRATMLSMLDGQQGALPEWSHPSHWAPFTLVAAGPGV